MADDSKPPAALWLSFNYGSVFVGYDRGGGKHEYRLVGSEEDTIRNLRAEVGAMREALDDLVDVRFQKALRRRTAELLKSSGTKKSGSKRKTEVSHG
jgi:hypothetical protein